MKIINFLLFLIWFETVINNIYTKKRLIEIIKLLDKEIELIEKIIKILGGKNE